MPIFPIILVFVLMFVLSPLGGVSHVLALTSDLTNDPVNIVKKYFSLDKRGARLQEPCDRTFGEKSLPGAKSWSFLVSDDANEWEIVSPLKLSNWHWGHIPA